MLIRTLPTTLLKNHLNSVVLNESNVDPDDNLKGGSLKHEWVKHEYFSNDPTQGDNLIFCLGVGGAIRFYLVRIFFRARNSQISRPVWYCLL